MGKFLLTYTGGSGMSSDPAEIEKVMAAWGQWYGQIGQNLVDGGAPTGQAKTISADGAVSDGSTTGLTGYTIISADSLDEAVASSKGCPVLADGGTVDVFTCVDMG